MTWIKAVVVEWKWECLWPWGVRKEKFMPFVIHSHENSVGRRWAPKYDAVWTKWAESWGEHNLHCKSGHF